MILRTPLISALSFAITAACITVPIQPAHSQNSSSDTNSGAPAADTVSSATISELEPRGASDTVTSIAPQEPVNETFTTDTSSRCPKKIASGIGAETSRDFSSEYSAVTKSIMLNAIELERFSLKYRLEAGHQPKFRKLRYFLTQEAGAAGGLAFEITGVNEFGKGRKRPLTLNKRHLKNSLSAAMTGSIVASAGSCFELSANVVHSVKNKKAGYDAKSANQFVSKKLNTIDQLLAQRDTLVQSHSGDPAYDRLVLEGKILKAMRQTFINEYSTFHTSIQSLTVMQNLFYVLNASYNAVGATAAGVARKATETPKLNGPANILFIVSGALAMATPILTTAGGWAERKLAHHAVERALNDKTTCCLTSSLFAADDSLNLPLAYGARS